MGELVEADRDSDESRRMQEETFLLLYFFVTVL